MEILEFVAHEIMLAGAQPWVMPFLLILAVWTFMVLFIRLLLYGLPDRFAMLHYHSRMALLYSLPLMLLMAWLVNTVLRPFAMGGSLPMAWLNAIEITPSGVASTVSSSSILDILLSTTTSVPFLAGMLMILTIFMSLIGTIRMANQIRSLRKIRKFPGQPLVASSLGERPYEELNAELNAELNKKRNITMSIGMNSGHDGIPASSTEAEALYSLVQKISRKLRISRKVSVYRHSGISVPMTIGWRHPRIILPDKTWNPQDLELILHHEMVHIRRGHFLFRTLEESLKSLFFIHPLVHMLTREITAWREMSCDSELLATSKTTGQQYATLLYQTLPDYGCMTPTLLSSSISANPNIKKRIEAMTHYPRKSQKWNQRRRASLALATVIMIPVLLLASCDFSTAPTETGELDAIKKTDEIVEEVFFVVEEMPEPVGGMKAIYENLIYPEEARRAGIEGRVIVQFVVDEEGNILDPVVVQGIGGGCDEAVVDAITSVEWKPGTQRGRNVKVQYMLPITFRLDTGDRESSVGG